MFPGIQITTNSRDSRGPWCGSLAAITGRAASLLPQHGLLVEMVIKLASLVRMVITLANLVRMVISLANLVRRVISLVLMDRMVTTLVLMVRTLVLMGTLMARLDTTTSPGRRLD